ncbi:hypothetical protein LY78DRAFT_669496 [Colletotrichum sublineola]|nr:hypothetical protein LY78DRAFT_669496 [Colletotrichum sublineola]
MKIIIDLTGENERTSTELPQESEDKAICPSCCQNYQDYNGTIEVYCSKQNHWTYGSQQARKVYELACGICQEDVQSKSLQAISCGHVFHAKCLKRFAPEGAKTCPYRCGEERAKGGTPKL